MNAIDRVLEVGQKTQWDTSEITKEAEKIFYEDVELWPEYGFDWITTYKT